MLNPKPNKNDKRTTKEHEYKVAISVNGQGSGTGIKALINGTVSFAQSSRAMKDTEKAQVEEKHGKAPVEHIVGLDGIAIYTHKSNPVKEISLTKLQEVWKEGGSITNWSDLGGQDAETQNLERPSDQATNIAKRARKINKNTEVSETVLLQPVYDLASALVGDAINAFSEDAVYAESAFDIRHGGEHPKSADN